MSGHYRRQQAQAMVEMALVAPLMFLLVFGIIDFGRYYAANAAVLQGSRAGARYAIVYPTAWTTASTAATSTIEGQIQQAAAGSASIVNDDSHISISYYVISTGSSVKCGSYSVAGGGFTAVSGYTTSTCVTPGSMVQVSVTYAFQLDSFPFNGLGSTTNITQTTQLLEEQ